MYQQLSKLNPIQEAGILTLIHWNLEVIPKQC